MTLLLNESADFADTALAGFVAAQSDRVVAVPGGVVRSTETEHGRVAVVMGGGSGHFPAFAGWVGAGFGHGAACGNIFASPSEAQIVSVARAADNGGGVLFVPINYAGDILNFSAAARRLRQDGVDARMVPITDDIASGPSSAAESRRGIAGSFIVLKIVGAAAESGRSLDEVEQVAARANDATRSFGVAFSGCTLPGSDHPLFDVPAGRMAIGLGIHGEPGISEAELGSANDVADILVDGLFEERSPEPGRAVAVLVNGLGTTKYDELFVLFTRIRARIEDAGMRLAAPVVGEQVTSLDMAGVSLSLTYLDDELEGLWLAPTDVAAFSRGQIGEQRARTVSQAAVAPAQFRQGAGPSREAARQVVAGLGAAVRVLELNEARLGDIDAVAGDGDHGAGMVRGARAALGEATDAFEHGAGAGTVLAHAGSAWSDRGGGTSGALWGEALVAAGHVVGDEQSPTPSIVRDAVTAFRDAIVERGGAAVGDKTMVDAIVPFAESFARSIDAGSSAAESWRVASAAATSAADATSALAPHLGRARIHGARSMGTPDAGAISFALVVSSLVLP